MSSNVSFALNLQSERGHSAIMGRLESELRILENLKKFLQAQIRSGREYSQSLGNASTSAMKTLTEGATNSECSTDSVVTKVCLHILEEVQSAATTVKENSDFLHGTTLVQLNELIQEKKHLLKLANEDHAKIKAKLDQFTDTVNKCKSEYLKNFQAYEVARGKYEEHCSKGRSGNKKVEDVREKFFRARKRLNISHVEYILAIHEATEYDRDFRTILLPGLLQVEQTWCEKQVGKWREILDQVWNNGPALPSAQGKLKDFEFTKEYLELIGKHKSKPLTPKDFTFEPACDSSNSPATQASIIVDSSTVEFLKSRLNECEKRLKASESNLASKTEEVAKLNPSMVSDMKGVELCHARCETERFRSLKNYLDIQFKEKLTDNVSQLDETLSIISEHSLKRGTNRFATLFRNVRGKKSVSFNDESSVISIKSNDQVDSASITTVEKSTAALLDEDWFHGVLPREDVVRLLKKDGDFLVRETTKNEERQIVLSVFWSGPKHFIVQTTLDQQFRFEGPIYPTVKELVDHYVRDKLPVTNRSGAVIKKPVKRENWELNNDDVQLIEKIGRGNFGDVYRARLNGTLVAVKTCKVNLPDEQKKKFLQEGRILKQYCHPNIVSFVGICVQKQPIMIVMELVPGGSLLTHLKNKGSSLTAKQLSRMCQDACAGMRYLEERGCIHRDLAARNCLLDESGIIKISDFGMSREEQEYVVSDGLKQIPIKWTAPEALNYGKYTSLSDVWSYGILMWEIFSRGQTPYTGMSNSKAREMIEANYRMPAPEGTPDVIYQLMTRCWQYEPEQRPRFSEIYGEIDIFMNSDLI